AFAQVFPGDCTGRHARGGFPRGGTTTAAIVAQAVFLLVAVVRVRGAEAVLDVAVVLRALVDVFDQQSDGRAGGAAFENTGENAHLIRFAALGGKARLARLAAIQISLQVLFRQGQPGRAAVHDAAERRPVTFAKGGDGEEVSNAVAGHSPFPGGLKRGRAVYHFAVCRPATRACSSLARRHKGPARARSAGKHHDHRGRIPAT